MSSNATLFFRVAPAAPGDATAAVNLRRRGPRRRWPGQPGHDAGGRGL